MRGGQIWRKNIFLFKSLPKIPWGVGAPSHRTRLCICAVFNSLFSQILSFMHVIKFNIHISLSVIPSRQSYEKLRKCAFILAALCHSTYILLIKAKIWFINSFQFIWQNSHNFRYAFGRPCFVRFSFCITCAKCKKSVAYSGGVRDVIAPYFFQHHFILFAPYSKQFYSVNLKKVTLGANEMQS